MSDEPTKHSGPWLLLVVFIVGCVLAILWLLAEVKRTKMIRDLNNPPPVGTMTNKS